MTAAGGDESFGTFSGLPAFTGVSDTYDSYQDSSLALRMIGPGARNAGFMLIAPFYKKHKEKILWIN